MRWVLYFIPVWFALALLVPIAWVLRGAYRRYQGQQPVICPETSLAAAVQVSTGHAMAMAIAGNPILRLQDCSRWPERRACGQQCLRQIG
jgi:hypothetical protein